MALSRFWSLIIVSSILYILFALFSGGQYSVGGIINGKQNDALVVGEISTQDLRHEDPAFYEAVVAGKSSGAQKGSVVYRLTDAGVVEICHGKQPADGLFPTCKNTIMDIWLPLIGYLTFFCGLLHLLSDSNAIGKLAKYLTPLFRRIFPELPPGHPAYGFMTMNFAANFLGLDSAATPFGLKAMESMQEINEDKNRASNSQIMFLCLHAAGLTLIPTSIIGYRAAQNSANPADIMLPCMITSFIGTLSALIFVSMRQKINLLSGVLVAILMTISAGIIGLLFYLNGLSGMAKAHFTGNLSNGVLLFIILLIVAYCMANERVFREKQTNIFDSFVTGAKDGFTTGVRVLPYMIAMLAALSIFRNSGLMNIIMSGLTWLLRAFHVDLQIIEAIPVALMRPFSAGGSRGFMLDVMKSAGVDSLTGRLASLFQGAAETTFYVVALYFGSVNVKDSRYTLGVMLLVDLVCVISGIMICKLYFH